MSRKRLLPCLILLGAVSALSADDTYRTQTIEGWTLRINERLLKDEKEDTEKALACLTTHLQGIVKAVPAVAVVELRKIPLWFNPSYPGVGGRAEYHPDAGWLKANHRNPEMAKAVEFTDIKLFEAETVRMPVFVLHELAHGYHDRVLTFEQPEILAAYNRAKESKSYDRVERWHGRPGRPNTFERAYAMTNHKEYFAETTEAFFGRNDFFPFRREELEKHDPEMFKVLKSVWHVE